MGALTAVCSPQSILEPRQEAEPLGGGARPPLGELLCSEQRAKLRPGQDPRFRGGLFRAWRCARQESRGRASRYRARQGEGEGRRGARGGRAAQTGVDPLHTCRELLLQRPHGPSGTRCSLIPGLRPPFASVDPFSPQSLQGDSTVVGTSKLRNLYERFEEELGRRQARAKAARPKWEPPKTKLDEDPGERSSRACWPQDWEVWAARNWSAITWCHREGQEVEPQWSRDRAGWLSSVPSPL